MPIEPRLHQVQCITRAGLHRMAYAEWGDPENARVLVCVHGLTRVGRDFDALARAAGTPCPMIARITSHDIGVIAKRCALWLPTTGWCARTWSEEVVPTILPIRCSTIW